MTKKDNQKTTTSNKQRLKKTIHELKDKVLEKADKISKRNNIQLTVFNERSVQEDILREAKVLKKSTKTVEIFAPKVAKEVGKWANKRAAATVGDIDRRIAREIERYDIDLAYVFGNRGKII